MEDSENSSTILLKIKDFAKDEYFQNIIFVIVEEPFSEKNFEKFIDYIARKQVSENHSYDEQAANYDNYAKDQVRDWITRIKSRYMQLLFRDKDEKYLANQIGKS